MSHKSNPSPIEASSALDPSAEERDILLELTRLFAEEFLADIPLQPAYQSAAGGGRGLLDSPIAEDGRGLRDSLELLRRHVTSVGLNPTSGRFLGYIPGGGLFHSALGDFLAAITNRYSGVFFASPGAARLEHQLVRWMADLIGYPEEAGGYLAAGGSVANLTAIVTARDRYGIEGPEIERSVCYLTSQSHHCIDKALRLAGLRRIVIRRIPVDDRFRMNSRALAESVDADRRAGLNPWMVVSSTGATNTGAVDPLGQIQDVADANDLWHHVDAAYGGFFVLAGEELAPDVQDAFSAMRRADSIVMDPHKTLFLPYGTGALIVRDRTLLLQSHTAGADYMQDTEAAPDELSPAMLSPELTKHFRGLRMWLPLQVLGVAPFRTALGEKLELARYFRDKVQEIDGVVVGPEPDLSVVTFRFTTARGDDDAYNRRLVQAMHEDGRVFMSSTQIDGRFTLRMAAVCFRTHRNDIDLALDVLSELRARIK